MLTFGSIIKSRMTEDFTLFGTLRKVARSTLNITITTLHPQKWHERKREPWSWIIGAEKPLMFSFFMYISEMITHLSYLQWGLMQLQPHQNERAIRVDRCYLPLMLPNCSRVLIWRQHESQIGIVKFCFVFIPKHTIFKEALQNTTCWACCMTSATHDGTRAHQYVWCLELKHKTKQPQLGSGSECLVDCARPGLGCLHATTATSHQGLPSCCSTVNSAFIVLQRMNFLILPSALENVSSRISVWWFSTPSLNFAALLLFLMARKQKDKSHPTNNTQTNAS